MLAPYPGGSYRTFRSFSCYFGLELAVALIQAHAFTILRKV